jgi:hypothetical protein
MIGTPEKIQYIKCTVEEVITIAAAEGIIGRNADITNKTNGTAIPKQAISDQKHLCGF